MTNTEGLTEEDYKAAVEAAIDLVRTKHPDLDLRAGTALRALLIEPSAFIDASQRDVVNRLRTAMSLSAMARETSVPREDAEAVLSNFGISLGGGTKASGLVRIDVTGSSDVTVREGVTFSTEDSVEFVSTETVSASVSPADGEAQMVSAGNGRYYFTVPVEAKEVGASGNVTQGRSMSCSTIIGNYYSSEAFSDFSGGEDGETVASAVARIPAAIAYRGMTNALSVRAQLSSGMSDPSLLHAVSCVGYRSRAQLRDKHNMLGVAVGGRVDVYARMFDSPGVVSFVAEGRLVGSSPDETSEESPQNTEGAYEIPIVGYPGFYAVKCVSPAEDSGGLGSLRYDLIRDTAEGAESAHDFKVSEGHHEETAWSAYQRGTIRVYDSTDGNSYLTSGGSATASAIASRPSSKSFKVELYWSDGIEELQKIADGDESCNVAADYVVRSPAICLVGVNASVRVRSGSTVSEEDLERRVASYINGRSFVGRLTRSELANVLIQGGVESLDLSENGMKLYGRVCGADGNWYYLDGDAIDVSEVGPEEAMLAAGTVVFAVDPGAVQIQIVT